MARFRGIDNTPLFFFHLIFFDVLSWDTLHDFMEHWPETETL